jgi:isoquinoline 1-oxidoreductase beta subunit
MGLTATYKSGHTVKNGAIVENNFNNYRMLQLSECPEMEVQVMRSSDPPEGAGEAGLPTIAPALVNAIFELSGKRIRTLPFDLDKV